MTYCWWLISTVPPNSTAWDVSNPVNSGISYPPQLVIAGFLKHQQYHIMISIRTTPNLEDHPSGCKWLITHGSGWTGPIHWEPILQEPPQHSSDSQPTSLFLRIHLLAEILMGKNHQETKFHPQKPPPEIMLTKHLVFCFAYRGSMLRLLSFLAGGLKHVWNFHPPKKKGGGDDLTEEVKMFKNGVKF